MTADPIDYKAAARFLGHGLTMLSSVMQAAVIAEKQGQRGMDLIEEDLHNALMYPGAAGQDSPWDGTESAEDFLLRMRDEARADLRALNPAQPQDTPTSHDHMDDETCGCGCEDPAIPQDTA